MLVVTGASGFLGRVVVRQAADRGIAVAAVARRPIAPPLVAQAIRVADYSALEPPERGATLIHLADESDIAAADADGPAHIERTRGAFAALAVKGWGHIVYASSGAVYGDQLRHARREDEEVAPSRPYAMAKLAGESIAVSAGGCALRFGNLYGMGMPRRVVLTDIIDQILHEGPIRLRDLKPVRDFIAVEDAAQGALLAAERRLSGLYNLGTGVGSSVGALAKIVLKIYGQPDRAIVETEAAGYLSHIVLDMTRTNAATGWHPATGIEAGIARLIDKMQ